MSVTPGETGWGSLFDGFLLRLLPSRFVPFVSSQDYCNRFSNLIDPDFGLGGRPDGSS